MTTTNGLDAQRRVYAVWAKFYDRIYQGLLARAQREAVAAACASGRDILEIGVGTGLTLPLFRARQAGCRRRPLAGHAARGASQGAEPEVSLMSAA